MLKTDCLKQVITAHSPFYSRGTLISKNGAWFVSTSARVGDLCEIDAADGPVLAEVSGADHGTSQVSLLEKTGRLSVGDPVLCLRKPICIPCGDVLLGRVIDGLARPIDERGSIVPMRLRRNSASKVPSPLRRGRITRQMLTGIRAIDGLLSVGVGQRVGLFAGSGVGKSTLLGQIARHCQSTRNVIVLVGERGREVAPFIEDCLGEDGLRRSVVVVATSDQTPQMRVEAVRTGMTLAHDFRSEGHDVLLLIDSITRMAMAQREIGLAAGEPATSRGYTPSVFQLIANVLEQLGTSCQGSVTAIATVLVEGDDLLDPIADCVRSVADGHIVLDRALAELGHFPSIDISASLSRVFNEVTNAEHQRMALAVRQILATYKRVEDLVQAGVYEPGLSPKTDRALALLPEVNRFLQQDVNHNETIELVLARLQQLAHSWNADNDLGMADS